MKMETPKMDVVRFNEADVIVASGELNTKWQANVYDVGGAKNNMGVKVTIPGQDPIDSNFEELEKIETVGWLAGARFYNTADDSATLKALIADDKTGGAGDYGRFNGNYESSDSGLTFWRLQ